MNSVYWNIFNAYALGYVDRLKTDKTIYVHPIEGTFSKRTNTENYDDWPIPVSELKKNVTMSTYSWETGEEVNHYR